MALSDTSTGVYLNGVLRTGPKHKANVVDTIFNLRRHNVDSTSWYSSTIYTVKLEHIWWSILQANSLAYRWWRGIMSRCLVNTTSRLTILFQKRLKGCKTSIRTCSAAQRINLHKPFSLLAKEWASSSRVTQSRPLPKNTVYFCGP